jgi:Tfp pilus assembly protein PilF
MKGRLILRGVLALGLLLLPAAKAALGQAGADLTGRLNAAYDLLEQGKYDQAQKIYEAILQQQPEHPLALNNLAALSCRQGKFDQALAQLRRALPQAKGYQITLDRVCNVEGVCAAFRQSTDKFGQENLEDLIKTNILMVQMAAANRGPNK